MVGAFAHYKASVIHLDKSTIEKYEKGDFTNGDTFLDATIEHEFIHYLEDIYSGNASCLPANLRPSVPRNPSRRKEKGLEAGQEYEKDVYGVWVVDPTTANGKYIPGSK